MNTELNSYDRDHMAHFVAAMTNYHKLNHLKQQKFILSWFWKPEVWNQNVDRAVFPLEALGENFWHSLASLVCGHISNSVSFSSMSVLFYVSFTIRIIFRFTWKIQSDLIFKIFNYIWKTPFSMSGHIHQVSEIWYGWISLEGVFFSYHSP